MTFPGEGFSHHRVLVPGGSVGRAGGSRGLLFLQLLLLAGELVCHGSILQLHARQRVLDVRQAGGLGSLELQCCRGRGLGAQLGARLVLECHIGIVAVAPLLLFVQIHALLCGEKLNQKLRLWRKISNIRYGFGWLCNSASPFGTGIGGLANTIVPYLLASHS